MLCRENPDATRIRPSQGDRGVDIYVREGDTWTVYQVKSFTGSLTSSMKRQIRKSWTAFTSLVNEKDLQVADWFLVRPENPTWQDEKWLSELTDGAPFRCSWRGLDYCDRLAADHQPVIDYYLNDGKARLQVVVGEFLRVAGMESKSATMTEPAAAYDSLESIHKAINSMDPHYRYDYEVRTVVKGAPWQVADEPGLVAAVSRGDGERETVFRIYARYREAPTDRPVPGRFNLVAEPNSSQAAAIRDFVDYGLPIRGVDATDMQLDLPGGLGTTGRETGGVVHLGPARLESAQPTELRLVIYDEVDDSLELAAADMQMEPATTGLSGEKFAVAGRERYGVFSVLLRVAPEDGRMNLHLTLGDITGAYPADVLQGLQAVGALRPPNRFSFELRNGPRLSDLMPVPNQIIDNLGPILRVCEDLATIQKHSLAPIRVPDLTETTVDQAREWVQAARLLRGDAIKISWDKAAITLLATDVALPDGDDAGGAFTVATDSPLVIDVGGVAVDLGIQRTQLMAARISPDDLDEGRVKDVHVTLIPAGDDTGTLTWAGRRIVGQ